MTTPPSFPALPGQGWSVHKKPLFSTRVASHVSGREARTPFFSYPLYEFELTFDGLDANGTWLGLGANSLQTLMGLFLQVQGQFGTFLYKDPTDSVVTGQTIATGDGATTAFKLIRTFGGFSEPVSWALIVTNVKVGGVTTSAWALTEPNTLTFTSPPASGALVAADITYAFQCRFIDDQNDFENILSGLWQVQSLKFRSVKP